MSNARRLLWLFFPFPICSLCGVCCQESQRNHEPAVNITPSDLLFCFCLWFASLALRQAKGMPGVITLYQRPLLPVRRAVNADKGPSLLACLGVTVRVGALFVGTAAIGVFTTTVLLCPPFSARKTAVLALSEEEENQRQHQQKIQTQFGPHFLV